MLYTHESCHITPRTPRRYDLKPTFDVKAGSEIFTLHTTVFAERSEFFRASRKPEWVQNDPNKPVDLECEDSEVFSTYVNCVYFGPEILQHYADNIKAQPETESVDDDDDDDLVNQGFIALVELYLMSDRLQDFITANLVIDELMRFQDVVQLVPHNSTVSLAYSHTVKNSPLRRLMRDYWVYLKRPRDIRVGSFEGLPDECIKDVMLEFYSVMEKHGKKTVDDAFSSEIMTNAYEDKCYYHQHDDKHPGCVPKPSSGQNNEKSS